MSFQDDVEALMLRLSRAKSEAIEAAVVANLGRCVLLRRHDMLHPLDQQAFIAARTEFVDAYGVVLAEVIEHWEQPGPVIRLETKQYEPTSERH